MHGTKAITGAPLGGRVVPLDRGERLDGKVRPGERRCPTGDPRMTGAWIPEGAPTPGGRKGVVMPRFRFPLTKIPFPTAAGFCPALTPIHLATAIAV